MEAPSAIVASGSPPFLKTTLSRGLAAPIHRKARLLTRDPLREADDSMELQVEDDVRRLVFLKIKSFGELKISLLKSLNLRQFEVELRFTDCCPPLPRCLCR